MGNDDRTNPGDPVRADPLSRTDQPPPSKAANQIYCQSCGHPIAAEAVICVHCGVQVRALVQTPAPRGPKDQTPALVLALFLSFWTWAYTYERDAAKFWVGLVVSTLGLLLLAIPSVVVWIWAVIDVARRPATFYTYYPNQR
jgi:hypothetical protein